MADEEKKATSSTSSTSESFNDRVNRFLTTGHAHLHASVAVAVDGVNAGLAVTEKTFKTKIQAPVNQAWHQATEVEQKVASQMDYLHKNRHEYGPIAIGGTAAAGGAIALLRGRGMPRTALTAALFGGIAYVAVYEPLPIRQIPELVRKQFQQK